jgi:hypothetical protein
MKITKYQLQILNRMLDGEPLQKFKSGHFSLEMGGLIRRPTIHALIKNGLLREKAPPEGYESAPSKMVMTMDAHLLIAEREGYNAKE